MRVRASTRLAIVSAASFSAIFELSPVSAGASPAKAEVTVKIFAHHYVVDGRVVDDLDVLESIVRSIEPRTVRLQACGATADRAQRAAAHRFRTSNLELSLLKPHDAACQAAPVSRGAAHTATGRGPFGINDNVVDQWWHASMP